MKAGRQTCIHPTFICSLGRGLSCSAAGRALTSRDGEDMFAVAKQHSQASD